MKALTARFSTLSRALNPHAKGHWRKKHKATKEARAEALLIGTNAKSSENLSSPVFTSSVNIDVRIVADTALARARKCYVPKDVQNLIAAIKPHIDGLKDAGWIADDNKDIVKGFECQIITGKAAQGKCELSITFKECEG